MLGQTLGVSWKR